MRAEETRKLIQELFESWHSSLVRYAWRLTGSIDMAEDLVQEVFLMLCRELRAGRQIHSPKGWTLRVLRHQIGRYLFLDRDRGIAMCSLDDLDALQLEQALKVEAQVDSSIELDDVTRLVSHLTPREEEVILLRMEAMKYREIAEHLEISPKSVATLLARAIRKLQEAAKLSKKLGLNYLGTDISKTL